MFAKPSLIITIVLTALFLCSCEADNDFANKAAYAFHDKCGDKKTGCVVTLKDLIKDKWERVYLFSDWTFSDTIAARIKMPYGDADVPDDYSRVIFASNKSIVYQDDIYGYHKSDYCDFSVNIDSLNKAPQPFFKNTDLFWLEATKEKAKSDCPNCISYILTPIKNMPSGNHK